MQVHPLTALGSVLVMILSAHAADPAITFSDDSARSLELQSNVVTRSERALLEERTAVEQASAQANSRSEYGLELRPQLSENDAGAALRIYLPAQWSKARLREQLSLVAESEQLRVDALEWQELMDVYQSFCSYRMLQKQRALLDAELKFLDPYLEKADLNVQMNQFSFIDRAKVYSAYLDLLNDRQKIELSLLDVEQGLHFMIGHRAPLEPFASVAKLVVPAQLEVDFLVQQALSRRADFRLLDITDRAISAAQKGARAEDGFRLKYIQPDYKTDLHSGESTWGLSASFVLPWGNRNPDIAVYEKQRALNRATLQQQRQFIEERLHVILQSHEACSAYAEQCAQQTEPLLAQLKTDLAQMDVSRLEQLRDQLLLRERLLDAALQATRMECRKEMLAIDLAKELGSIR